MDAVILNRHYADDHTPYGRHVLGMPNGVPVADILEHAIQEGRPLHLDWGDQDVRGLVADQVPLPRRTPLTGARRPIEYETDLRVLEAVYRGLCKL